MGICSYQAYHRIPFLYMFRSVMVDQSNKSRLLMVEGNRISVSVFWTQYHMWHCMNYKNSNLTTHHQPELDLKLLFSVKLKDYSTRI